MAHLNVKLPDERLDALKQFAARRQTPVSWLIKDYVEYLLAGGTPVNPYEDTLPTTDEVVERAQRRGSFDWLADEPDLYSLEVGEPV